MTVNDLKKMFQDISFLQLKIVNVIYQNYAVNHNKSLKIALDRYAIHGMIVFLCKDKHIDYHEPVIIHSIR